jgi:hypothetical protein
MPMRRRPPSRLSSIEYSSAMRTGLLIGKSVPNTPICASGNRRPATAASTIGFGVSCLGE